MDFVLTKNQEALQQAAIEFARKELSTDMDAAMAKLYISESL